MPKNLVISDLHLGHENILEYCKRPFQNVDEMNWAIFNNWNSVVAKEDTIYCLGDLAYGKGSKEVLKKFLPELNGRIILILGNHDHETVTWYKRYGIEEVHGGEYWVYEPGVMLSHRPYPTKTPWINIHGHTHNLMYVHPEEIYVNVCVEVTNYTPVDLDELIKIHRGSYNACDSNIRN